MSFARSRAPTRALLDRSTEATDEREHANPRPPSADRVDGTGDSPYRELALRVRKG
jgi:hypothetical protein